MPASASGVSMTRSSPKSFCSPSVTRNTPPSLPTSSPMISTLGSASIALRIPMLRPLASVICAISGLLRVLERIEVRAERRALLIDEWVGFGVHILEHRHRRRIGHLQAALAQFRGDLIAFGLDLVQEGLVDLVGGEQVAAQPLDRVL